jgi:tetratricopeptide (TPR) repeat protein
MVRLTRHQCIRLSVALAVMLASGLAFAVENRPGSQDVSALLQEAKDAARAIVDTPYLRETVLRGIAGAQSEEGRFDAALETAALIADGYLRTAAWRQIAVARARAGDREAAGRLLGKVLQEVASFKNVRVEAMIATAEAQAQIGDVPGGLKTAMAVEILSGRSEALRNIALVQAKGGDHAGAIETAGAIADEKVMAQALRGIAVARAEKGDRDGALQTAAGIRDPYLKAGALRRIAVTPAMLKDRAAALAILKQALDSAGAIQGGNEKADALGGITMAFLAAGDVNGALKTVALIERAVAGKPHAEVAATTRSKVLRAIAIAQAQAGDSPRSLQTAGSIAIPYMQASALAEVAVAQVERGDRIAAEATLRKAVQVSSAIREFSAKAPALLGIAQAYAKVGDRAAATKTFRQARQTVRVSDDERYKTDALIDLAMVQSGAGDFSGAVETADGIRDVHARAHAWRVVAAAQGENREPVFSWIAGDGAPVRKAYALLGLAEGLLQGTR